MITGTIICVACFGAGFALGVYLTGRAAADRVGELFGTEAYYQFIAEDCD